MSEPADRQQTPLTDTLTAPAPSREMETPTKPKPRKTKKRSGRGWLIGSGVAVAALVAGLVWAKAIPLPEAIASRIYSTSRVDAGKFLTDPVERAPFRIAVRVRGTVDSLRSVTLSNKVEGSTTIIWIVPEGTQVKEGDLLVELDSSALVEQEKQQVIALTQANAALKKAEEGLEIQRRQNESDVAAAQLALVLTALDLEKYTEGEFPQLENEQLGLVQVAKEELNRATEVYEYSQRLAQKGYASQNQLEADRIAMMKAQVSLAAAEEKLKVLQDYEKERKIRELTALAEEAVRARERVERQGIAALAQFQADLEAARLTKSVEQEKLDRIRTQIANSKIYAPQAGEVIYATDDDRRGDGSEVIAEGTAVRERMDLINLPDLSQMKVDARIHESMISRVREGLPVLIRIDAAPGEVFTGKVLSVSPVPVDGDWLRPDLKEYSCTIGIDYTPSDELRLKPGLTAEVEIVVQDRSDVLQVPFQSVVTAGKSRYSYVLTPDGTERRELLIGATNDTHVEILDGLAEGEKVILNPRTHFSEELNALDAKADNRFAAGVDPAGSVEETTPDAPTAGDPADKADDRGSPGKPTAESSSNANASQAAPADKAGDAAA